MPERTSKENGHWHYYKIDEDGNGRTTMWVDKRTKSKHFHRITKFVVEGAGRDEHTHDLRGNLEEVSKEYRKRKDGSRRKTSMSQNNTELEAREIEKRVKQDRRKDMRRRSRRRFSDYVRETKQKGY
tara:strand:+ start:1281 stop:1661 length:381 start_codon:yes stop_codon:yes gene_type:complete